MLKIKQNKYILAAIVLVAMSSVSVMASGCFKEKEPEISYERNPSLVSAITTTTEPTTTWASEDEDFSWMEVVEAIATETTAETTVATTGVVSEETSEETTTTETTEFVPCVVFSHQFSSYEHGLQRCNEEAAAYGYSFGGGGTYEYDGHTYRASLSGSGLLVVTQLS